MWTCGKLHFDSSPKNFVFIQMTNVLTNNKSSSNPFLGVHYYYYSCGHCSTKRLQNAKECQCCHELEGCMDSLDNELVLQEVETRPNCITSWIYPRVSE